MEQKDSLLLEFAKEYQSRFNRFRTIEAQCIQSLESGLYNYPSAAYRLLADMEKCYSCKAYYAAIVLAFSSIEIYLTETEKLRGNSKQLLKKAGLHDEVDWLRQLRNDIMHGNPNKSVKYDAFDLNQDLENALEKMCIKAFTLVHSLPLRMQKLGEFA